jgi:hypothetical protein
MECRHSGQPAPTKFKTAHTVDEVMLTAFWEVHGALYSEFVLTGATIKSERYAGTLPHTSARTAAEIHRRLGLTVFDHPPNNPDVAPSNFHLLPKLKKHLRGHHILSDDEVKTAVKTWFEDGCTLGFSAV